MSVLNDIYKTTIEGKYSVIKDLIKKAVDESINPQDIILNTLSPAMKEVGNKFNTGEFYMPDMLLSAKAMKEAMKILKPLLINKGESLDTRGNIVIGSVKGDIHDIGKNLIIIMAEGQDFNVVNLGANVDYQKLMEAIKEYKPNIVGFSGLLTTTLANIPHHLKDIEDAGLRKEMILSVGGAPVTRDFADRYNIEIYAENASTAVQEFIKALEKSSLSFFTIFISTPFNIKF